MYALRFGNNGFTLNLLKGQVKGPQKTLALCSYYYKRSNEYQNILL